jgi:hypothetical protein
MATELGVKSNGIAFLVSAGIVYEIIAAACSSPQTTEINADKRSDTLMKWVNIGMVQAGGFIAVAAFFDTAHRKPIIAGGAAAGILMYIQYWHAREAGLKNISGGTEGSNSDRTIVLKTALGYDAA